MEDPNPEELDQFEPMRRGLEVHFEGMDGWMLGRHPENKNVVVISNATRISPAQIYKSIVAGLKRAEGCRIINEPTTSDPRVELDYRGQALDVAITRRKATKAPRGRSPKVFELEIKEVN